MFVEMLKHPTQDDWCEVLRRCLVTVGKKSSKIPDMDWRVKMLLCRHSPIRYLEFSFFLKDIPYWLSTELCRHHIGCEKYVRSQRDDRNKDDVPRAAKPQGAYVDMILDVNAEALLTIMNKRLCGAAATEMQRLMLLIRSKVVDTNPEFKDFMVPMCKHIGGCKEFISCKGNCLFFKEVN